MKALKKLELSETEFLSEEISEVDLSSIEPEVNPKTVRFPFTLQKANFYVDAEFRRVFGREVNTRTKVMRNEPVHHRKLWLVKPYRPWMKPDISEGALEMVPSPEGFIVALDQQSDRAVDLAVEFARVIRTHDLHALQDFVARHPYHVNGLLSLAQVCNQRANHEEAFILIKRALYTMETNFHHSFQPFPRQAAPTVSLHPKSYATLGRGLWEYMHCLHGQGLFGTALEVGKLLLLCTQDPLTQEEQLRDPMHILLHVDYYAIRARRYAFFDEIAPLCLEWFLPNVAFNKALGLFQSLPRVDDVVSELNDITIADCKWNAPCTTASSALIRACLLYPLAVHVLVEKAGANLSSMPASTETDQAKRTWGDLLTLPPLRNFDTPAGMPSTLVRAFVDNAVAYKSTTILQWLYRCCMKIDQWCASPVFTADLERQKKEWLGINTCTLPDEAATPALWNSYSDLMSAECREDSNRVLPKVISTALDEAEGATAAYLDGLEPNPIRTMLTLPWADVSLQSHPAIVFFHCMLPWGKIERGAPPVRIRDIGVGFVRTIKDVLFSIAMNAGVVVLYHIPAAIWRGVTSLISRLNSLRRRRG